MGSRAEDILLTFGLDADDAKKYSVVRDRFEKHFVVRRNVIFERARFHQRAQGEVGPSKTFLMTCTLCDNCEHGDMQDDILHDRIVIGIRDVGLSQKLQLNDKLALATVLTQVSANEMVSKQSHTLQQLNTGHADAVKRTSNRADATARKPKKRSGRKTDRKDCYRCGVSPSHKLAVSGA